MGHYLAMILAAVPLLLIAASTADALQAKGHSRKHLGVNSGSIDTVSLLEELQQRRAGSKVWMSPHEISLIESYLRPSDIMMEWGSGYSTLWYSQFVKEYYSVEHHKGWYDQMKPHIETRNVHYLDAPVEPGFNGWEGGFAEGTYEQFEQYVKRIADFNVDKFDRVLIDGRARAVCAEFVLKFLKQDSIVFIHDYNPREGYHKVVDMLYDKIAEVYEDQSVVVLRPKKEALLKAAADEALITDFKASGAYFD